MQKQKVKMSLSDKTVDELDRLAALTGLTRSLLIEYAIHKLSATHDIEAYDIEQERKRKQ